MRRARARLRDRARRELAGRRRRGARTRAHDPGGGAERRAHAARRPHRGVDARARVRRRVRRPRHDDGRVPVGGAPGRAATGAARRRERLPAETPAAVVVRASWPDERVVTRPSAASPPTSRDRGDTHRARARRSGTARRGGSFHLYSPRFAHMFRRRSRPESTGGGRRELRRPPRTSPTSRPRSRPAEGPAHRLDHRHVRDRGRQGGGHRAGHRRGARRRRGRPARRATGALPGRERVAEPVCRRQGRRRRPRLHRRRPRDRRGGVGPTGDGHRAARRGAASAPITKPGLGLAVGAPAINPVPRA